MMGLESDPLNGVTIRTPDSDPRSGPPSWGSLARASARVSARAAAHARGQAVSEAMHTTITTQIVVYLGFIPLHWGVPPNGVVIWGSKKG